MPVQITIRNVPEEMRDELKLRAALNRQSMQAFMLSELERILSRPSNEELMRRAAERAATFGSRMGSDKIVEMIREDRGR